MNIAADNEMMLSLVVAVASNGVIGRDNDLPWRLSADLRRFKRITMGHPILMGRRTYESIGRPLPGRRNMVLSRQPAYQAPAGCDAATSMEAALQQLRADGVAEAFVIGGAEIYQQALPFAERLHLTEVLADIDGDACFPTLTDEDWSEQYRERHRADADNDHAHIYRILERRR